MFLEYLQSKSLDWLSQLVEEALIFSYDRVKLGVTLNEDHLGKFLALSLDFLDLSVSKNFAEFLPAVRDNLTKLHARLLKTVSKKDQHPLLHLFLPPTAPVDQPPSDTLSFEQLAALH